MSTQSEFKKGEDGSIRELHTAYKGVIGRRTKLKSLVEENEWSEGVVIGSGRRRGKVRKKEGSGGLMDIG